ncbi:N-lysine methyltransferase KMT5A [Chionoecetes opilio]|uniref:N-lysine methyltransferase KMT5A n=1 Tax=Chionoecetes opilio TaxID=41210 RepID=A0A8J5CTM0_CHIOP|nr:N-lysine methyltransferase KMT5A [Chionoecetes opilio]
MVSHNHTQRNTHRRSRTRRKMVKGKRRTNRNSKDENAVVGPLDGPKGPKDCRLETRLVNGALVGSKMASLGATHSENKITSYFSPSRSPPVADDAETEDATILEGECGKDPELSNAQLTRPYPPSAPVPSAVMNGIGGTEQTTSPPNAALKRTVCTRSQALKELQLQSSTAALSNGVTPSSSSTSPPQCAISIATPCTTPDMPTPLSTPATPTSSTSLGTDDCSSPHTGPPTPHKIQAFNEEKLRLDSPLSPSTALSKLKLSLTPKKLKFNDDKTTKARRKIATQNTTRVTLQSKTEKVSKGNTVTAMSNGDAKPALRNTQMTTFFPIRRSERKPKTTLLQERQKEIEERICSGKEEDLTVKDFGAKGRGVVTTRKFKKGEYVVEYIGDLIDVREAKQRESRYAQDSTKGCYNYYFTFQNQQYCVSGVGFDSLL